MGKRTIQKRAENAARARATLAKGDHDSLDEEAIPCHSCGRFGVAWVEDAGLDAACASGQLDPDIRPATVLQHGDLVRVLRHRVSGDTFDLFRCPRCGHYRVVKE